MVQQAAVFGHRHSPGIQGRVLKDPRSVRGRLHPNSARQSTAPNTEHGKTKSKKKAKTKMVPALVMEKKRTKKSTKAAPAPAPGGGTGDGKPLCAVLAPREPRRMLLTYYIDRKTTRSASQVK